MKFLKSYQITFNSKKILLYALVLAMVCMSSGMTYDSDDAAAIVEQSIIDEIDDKGEVSVIVILRKDKVSFPLKKTMKKSIVQTGT